VISVSDASVDGTKEDDVAGYTVTHRDYRNSENNDAQESATAEGGVLCTEHYDLVAVCSGLHNTPFIPTIPNIDSFQGTILHSSSYKDASIFSHKRVLVLGSGETAMDIAHRAVSNPSTKSVALNVRNGFLSIPHNITADRPLDVFITNLFEHAYEHPWVHALRLRWTLSTIVIRLFLFLAGSSLGFNQWSCAVDTVKRGYHIINKSHAAMSHLNVPIKKLSVMGRFWMWMYGETHLKPIHSFHKTTIDSIDTKNGTTVQFDNGTTFDADMIIMATGYKQSFPFLSDAIKQEHRDEYNKQSCGGGGGGGNLNNKRHELDEDFLPSEHFIINKRRPRLAFIGFVRPNVGAIPPMSELQVMWWLCNLRGQVKRLSSAPTGQNASYMVLGRKYPYGVDYGNYMHRVAEDIDAAPTLSCLLQSSKRNKHPWRALYTYCQGQAHIPLFRLRGPFASKMCWDVTTNELWDVCVRRGAAENIGLLSVTIVSFWMNLAACLLECLWCLCCGRRPSFFTRYG